MQSGAILLEESHFLKKTHLESDCSKGHPEPLAGICPFTYTAVPAQLYPYSCTHSLEALQTDNSLLFLPASVPDTRLLLLSAAYSNNHSE